MGPRRVAGSLALVLLAFVGLPCVEAALDEYQTPAGLRALLSYPDEANEGDEFWISLTVFATATSGTIQAPTAPNGWAFVGCQFVAVDVGVQGPTHSGQAVRLRMTDDTCAFQVELATGTSAQQTGSIVVAGAVATDDPVWAGQFVAVVLWLAYNVFCYFLPKPVRVVGVALGLLIVLVPISPSVMRFLVLGQAGAIFLSIFIPDAKGAKA